MFSPADEEGMLHAEAGVPLDKQLQRLGGIFFSVSVLNWQLPDGAGFPSGSKPSARRRPA